MWISLSAYTHQFPALCFKHVWIMFPCLGTSTFLLLPWSNRFGFLVPCCVQTSVSTRVSNTFGFRFLVCVHASVPDPYLSHASVSGLLQTRLILVACCLVRVLVSGWKMCNSQRTPVLHEIIAQSQCCPMCSWRRHDLCETVFDLMNGTMDLQNVLTASCPQVRSPTVSRASCPSDAVSLERS